MTQQAKMTQGIRYTEAAQERVVCHLKNKTQPVNRLFYNVPRSRGTHINETTAVALAVYVVLIRLSLY